MAEEEAKEAKLGKELEQQHEVARKQERQISSNNQTRNLGADCSWDDSERQCKDMEAILGLTTTTIIALGSRMTHLVLGFRVIALLLIFLFVVNVQVVVVVSLVMEGMVAFFVLPLVNVTV